MRHQTDSNFDALINRIVYTKKMSGEFARFRRSKNRGRIIA
jgi:uncharacterized membrane protein